MRFRPVVFLGCFLLAGCSSKLAYLPDYPLKEDSFRSRDGLLAGRIPAGWFASTDDTLAPALEAWLLREDMSAEIVFREITLDSLTSAMVQKEGLKFLARATYPFHFDSSGALPPQTAPDVYTIGKREFCSYEIRVPPNQRRIVLFRSGPKYYECETRGLKGDAAPTDPATLFRIQQSVLSSLVF